MDDINVLSNVKVVVFEGPDCCGKTTLLNKTKELLEKKGFKVGTYKFPVYEGLFGPNILDHLTNWDASKHTKEECFKKQIEFSKQLTVNKLAAFRQFCNHAKNYDYVLVDRFVLSQYIYDIAWADILDKRRKNKFYTELVLEGISERAEIVLKSYMAAFPNIVSVVVTQNPVIKAIVENNKNIERKEKEKSTLFNRRYDQYDSNKDYQKAVAKIFDKIVYNDTFASGYFLNETMMTLWAINSEGGLAGVAHDKFGEKTPLKELKYMNVKKYLKRKEYWDNILKESQDNELEFITGVL